MNITETIPHWLTKQAGLHPNKTAVELVDGSKLTFKQLQEKSTSFARRLASLQVEKGRPVAILSTNNLDMIIAIHALSYLEAIVVLLNTRLTKYELMDQLTRSEATLLLTTESLKEEKQLPFAEQYTFSKLHEQEEKDVQLADEINLHTPFTMMYTSGTTGAPKGVVHTYGNHWWSAVGSVLNLGLHDKDKWLLTLPLFHVGGLSILIRSLMYGMTIYFMKNYDVKTLKEALYERRVTIASLVTLMLQQLLEEMQGEPLPKDVRCILLGGGSVSPSLLSQVEKQKVPLFQSYGMTETSSQIVTLSAAYAREKLGSAGKALIPANVAISNPDDDGVGEIIVKGPMVFSGYHQLPTENEKAFSDGWFHTGDLGYLDREGFLYVVDRRNDLIISGGENIYPSEIEDVLVGFPSVKEAAVVGKRDEKWGQVVVAFIVTEEKFNDKELLAFLKQRLASYKIPKEIIRIDELPRNASNKVMRHRLAEEINNRM